VSSGPFVPPVGVPQDSDGLALGNAVKRIAILEAVEFGGCGPWIEPTLLNSWTNTGSPFCDAAYRVCSIGIQMRGAIEGGADGTVAFELDAADWPECDKVVVTAMIGSPLGLATLYLSASDGSVTVTAVP
jgi:hypothetical protein